MWLMVYDPLPKEDFVYGVIECNLQETRGNPAGSYPTDLAERNRYVPTVPLRFYSSILLLSLSHKSTCHPNLGLVVDGHKISTEVAKPVQDL